MRRDHAFEDSFYQLRMRNPDEMRAKLSVVFQGEAGVDAGGVTREWYQVMSREMFNPQFSLFQPVPEGGTTFQPNPSSAVQNDEARGTNHLDFFKFVGRVVGKALHDGQLIDAHFTRSFYKHMLGEPLTYLDIEAVDPDFFKNLTWMLENDITDILDLTFAEETDFFGQKNLVELIPDGAGIKVRGRAGQQGCSGARAHGPCARARADSGRWVLPSRPRRPPPRCRWTPGGCWHAPLHTGSPSACTSQVTNDNKKEYVNLVARHRMTTVIRDQIDSFLKGFWDLVPRHLIRCVIGGVLRAWGCAMCMCLLPPARAHASGSGA